MSAIKKPKNKVNSAGVSAKTGVAAPPTKDGFYDVEAACDRFLRERRQRIEPKLKLEEGE